MQFYNKVLFGFIIIYCSFVFVYYKLSKHQPAENFVSGSLQLIKNSSQKDSPEYTDLLSPVKGVRYNKSVVKEWSSDVPIYVWCVLTKVHKVEFGLLKKFTGFLSSLLYYSTRKISLNVIVDQISKNTANDVIHKLGNNSQHIVVEVLYYDIVDISNKIRNITTVMEPYFSSIPGTYYSDSLFYISLGLHIFAPLDQDKIILLDVDTYFKDSITNLYEHFSKFCSTCLFGLAPELSPVYHHILWKWRKVNQYTKLGKPFFKGGFSGLNSGVVLLNLDHLRNSEIYNECLKSSFLKLVTEKYKFKGHLGDQDFYTLLYLVYPELIYVLPCGWNRQLCKWWKYHGYKEMFDYFYYCDEKVHLYHGNCNTRIPVV